MSFFRKRQKNWQKLSPKKAIRLIDKADQQTLVLLITHQTSSSVCEAALKKLTAQELLAAIAKDERVKRDYKQQAARKVTDQALLNDIAKTALDWTVREIALASITDQNVLADVAKNDKMWEMCKLAVARITSQSVLEYIAENYRDNSMRIRAAQKLLDAGKAAQCYRDILQKQDEFNLPTCATAAELLGDHILAQQLRQKNYCLSAIDDVYDDTGLAAVAKLTEKSFLMDVVSKAKLDKVSIAALKKLLDSGLMELDFFDTIARNDKRFYVRRYACEAIGHLFADGCSCERCGIERAHEWADEICIRCGAKREIVVCKNCEGSGTELVQIEYASYQSGHTLGEDRFEERTCFQCNGSGKVIEVTGQR